MFRNLQTIITEKIFIYYLNQSNAIYNTYIIIII